MRRGRIALLVFGFFACTHAVAAKPPQNPHHIALPNPGLLGCVASTCQLWLEKNPPADTIYPLRMNLDVFDGFSSSNFQGASRNGAPYGLITWYDKSVPLEEVEAAVNSVYGSSMMRDTEDTPVKLWRVETEKFAIQLIKCPKHFEGCDEGNLQLIYISITPKAPSAVLEAPRLVATAKHRRVVLTNPKVIACLPDTCQFWLEKDLPDDAAYPIQLRLDISDGHHFSMQTGSYAAIPNGPPYAFTVMYDRSVPVNSAATAVNSVYGDWVYANSADRALKLWRIEREKFAIQLSTCPKRLDWCNKGNLVMIYIPIGYRYEPLK